MHKLRRDRMAESRDAQFERSSKHFSVAVKTPGSSKIVDAASTKDDDRCFIVGFILWEVLQDDTSEAERQA